MLPMPFVTMRKAQVTELVTKAKEVFIREMAFVGDTNPVTLTLP